MNDNQTEQEIQAKGLTAPRVTPVDIEANILHEHYFRAAEGSLGAGIIAAFKASGGNPKDTQAVSDSMVAALGAPQPHQSLMLLTFCVLVLKNGFTVTGESACASPENFDAEIGKKIARQNAVQKIWPLMGYALKQRLSEQST